MPFLAFSIFYIKLSPHQTVLLRSDRFSQNFSAVFFCTLSCSGCYRYNFHIVNLACPFHPAIQDLAGSQQPQKCKILLNPLSATGDPVPVQPRKCKILLNSLSATGDPVPVQPRKYQILLNPLSATGDPVPVQPRKCKFLLNPLSAAGKSGSVRTQICRI